MNPPNGERGIYQLLIIHLSDIHFGSSHAFNPAIGPDGTSIADPGVPSFVELLLGDLVSPDPACPVCVAITGDFTTKCEESGFNQARDFLDQLAKAKIFGRTLGKANIHIVPGNHDVAFEKADPVLRWQLFTDLANKALERNFQAAEPMGTVELHDHSDDGFMVLTLNSEIHVRKGSNDEFRGQVDQAQLAKVTDLLESSKEKLQRSICIALVHHHPVLIPHLVESGRNYDAVVNSGMLLNILNKHGFHLILHGHKHWPCTFTSDTRAAYESAYVRPLTVVAGGSLGSRALPQGTEMNCYNRIWIKWNSGSEEVRIAVDTRGLQRRDKDNQLMPATKWHWRTMRSDDRAFSRNERIPLIFNMRKTESRQGSDPAEVARKAEYERCRRNMAVVEVRPSLEPHQKYEAVFWIVGHSGANGEDYRTEQDWPVRVIWSAGPQFKQVSVRRVDDPRFAGRYSYYGPMLVQAELEFSDGQKELLYVYARIPAEGDYVIRRTVTV